MILEVDKVNIIYNMLYSCVCGKDLEPGMSLKFSEEMFCSACLLAMETLTFHRGVMCLKLIISNEFNI